MAKKLTKPTLPLIPAFSPNLLQIRPFDTAGNQLQVTTPNSSSFYSYGTLVAHINDNTNQTFIASSWNHSATTSKYRSDFLNECTTTTREKLRDAEYIYLG